MARTKQTARKAMAGMVPPPGVSEAARQRAEAEIKDPRNWKPGGKFGPPLPAPKPFPQKTIQKREVRYVPTFIGVAVEWPAK